MYIYIYIYIYTSVNPCISMHGAEQNRVKRCRVQWEQRQHLRTPSSSAKWLRSSAYAAFSSTKWLRSSICAAFSRAKWL